MSARRGRPPATNSADTRERIVRSACGEFAAKGYAATSIASVASSSGLAPSAIYHYFGGKWELYEAVFEHTAERIWEGIGKPDAPVTSLRDSVANIVDDGRSHDAEWVDAVRFFALVPVEAALQPEFRPLLDRQTCYQDQRFAALADAGIASGELVGVERDAAFEFLRTLLVGWFFERYLVGRRGPDSGKALLSALDSFCSR